MAEENVSNIAEGEPPKADPLAKEVSPRATTLRLKPVIRKPVVPNAGLKLPTQVAMKPVAHGDTAVTGSAPDAVEQLKTVTQKLKGVTQQIPQQAILHKTGIIGDEAMTESQRNAAKAKTVRISLSDAIGVSPVKEEAATPIKTIRIKRPAGIAPHPPTAALRPQPQAEDSAPAGSKPAEVPLPPSVTQRKTIKIQRPVAGVKPAGKFSIKKPEEDVGEVADIPELPPVPTLAPQGGGEKTVKDVPAGVAVVSIIVQFAACVAIGALAWFLYQDTQIAPF